jgi:hypothetical protein
VHASACGLFSRDDHVRITELPIAGIKIELVDRLIPVALFLSAIYLTAAFAVCLTDNVINFGGATFIDERVRESEENMRSGKELFAKYLFDLFKHYIPEDDADYIAKEIAPLLYGLGSDIEDAIAELADDRVKQFKASLPMSEITYGELIENVRRSHRAALRDAPLSFPTVWPVRAYYYFRVFRVYVLEAAFPLVLAAIALAAGASNRATELFQHLLSPI